MVGGGDVVVSEHPLLEGEEDSLLSVLPLLASGVLAKGLLLGVLDEVGGVAGEEWSIATASGATGVHLWDVTRGEGSTQVWVLRKEHRSYAIYTQCCHLLKLPKCRRMTCTAPPCLMHARYSLTT